MDEDSHFCQKFQNKITVEYQSEMARIAIESEFQISKMGAGGHFLKIKKKLSCVSIWNGQKCHQKWVSDIQFGRRQPLCKTFHKN